VSLRSFLRRQREQRIDRIRLMVQRLAELGIRIDGEAILAAAAKDGETAVGRPWIARALVAAGHVPTVSEAFDRWLGRGRAAFVPRAGASVPHVVACIHEAGGIASLAHPGSLARDEWIPAFGRAGLDALEAYHSDHDPDATAHYLAMAEQLGLAVSGGSDYHGDESHGPASPGAVSLPQVQYDRLVRLKPDPTSPRP
jgi:3',5'-nucleoside bisphosphate phosphatase